jgi:acetyl-CoA acyltransferase 1
MFVYCVRKLELDLDRVNVNGGAIALGHPLDKSYCYFKISREIDLRSTRLRATGARQIVTGLNELERRNGKVSNNIELCGVSDYCDPKVLVTSMCMGTGMGAAAVFLGEA